MKKAERGKCLFSIGQKTYHMSRKQKASIVDFEHCCLTIKNSRRCVSSWFCFARIWIVHFEVRIGRDMQWGSQLSPISTSFSHIYINALYIIGIKIWYLHEEWLPKQS